MKKTVGYLLGLAIIAAALPAYAAGGISATEETWYVTPNSDNYKVYYYASVENTGSDPETVNNLLFEIQDSEGKTIESTEKYKLYPEILAPGESGWLVISQKVEDVESKSVIDHYTLTITSKKNDDEEDRRIPASAEFIAKDSDDNKNMIYTTISNEGDEAVFDAVTAYAVRDEAGKLLYADSTSLKNIGLPGSGSLQIRAKINSDIIDELDKAGTKIASAEAIAYSEIDLDD